MHIATVAASHAAASAAATVMLIYLCFSAMISTGGRGVGWSLTFAPAAVPLGGRVLPLDPGLPSSLENDRPLPELFTLGALTVLSENTAATLMHKQPHRPFFITTEQAIERGFGAILVNLYGGSEDGALSVTIPGLVPTSQITFADVVADIAVGVDAAEVRAGLVVVLNVQQQANTETICTRSFIKHLHDELEPLRELGLLFSPRSLGSLATYDDMATRLSTSPFYPTGEDIAKRVLVILAENGASACASQYMKQHSVSDANLFFATGRSGDAPPSAFAQYTRIGTTFSQTQNAACADYPSVVDPECVPALLQIFETDEIPDVATPGVYFPRTYTTCNDIPDKVTVCVGQTLV